MYIHMNLCSSIESRTHRREKTNSICSHHIALTLADSLLIVTQEVTDLLERGAHRIIITAVDSTLVGHEWNRRAPNMHV